MLNDHERSERAMLKTDHRDDGSSIAAAFETPKRMTAERRAEIERWMESNYMWSDELQELLDELTQARIDCAAAEAQTAQALSRLATVSMERDAMRTRLDRYIAQFTTHA